MQTMRVFEDAASLDMEAGPGMYASYIVTVRRFK